MVLLASVFGKPIVFVVAIPIVLCFIWVAILAWESRLPPENRFLRKTNDEHSGNSFADQGHSIQH